VIIRARPLVFTFPADARSGSVDAGVCFVVSMALWAMSLVSVKRPTLPILVASIVLLCAGSTNALSAIPASIFPDKLMAMNAVSPFTPVATAHVLFVSNWLQMSRVHTSAVSAEVVEFKAFRDSADEILVHQPVCPMGFLLPVANTVTSGFDISGPEPTVIRLSIWDVFIQQIKDRIGLGHSGNLNFPGCLSGWMFARPLALQQESL
jgi:hypothetical protein